MIQVARNGQIILELNSQDELSTKISDGEVLPTDHYIVVGMPSWHLVSTFSAKKAVSYPRIESDKEAVALDQFDRARAQIISLIQTRPFPKPSRCTHCEATELRSANLVWQQSTRVGGAIDTNLDITVFGSSTLQGLNLTPPPEPTVPEAASGGCLTMVASAFVFIVVFELMFLTSLSVFENPSNGGPIDSEPNLLYRIGGIALFVLFGYIAFRVARAVYRWDARRGQKGLCETQIEVAKHNLRWRNTWICTSCGGKTVVVE
jgi:hypothetical protein